MKNKTQKTNKRLMAGTITRETKREGQKKAKRQTTRKNQKKGRKLIPFVVGSYFTHSPSNVASCKSRNLIIMGGLEQPSLANAIFLSMVEAKAH
jgi:hypothetical protein